MKGCKLNIKKTFTKLFTLLLIFCMMGVSSFSTALATNEPQKNKFITVGNDSVVSQMESQGIDTAIALDDAISPRMICHSGVLPGIKQVQLYPINYDEATNSYTYDDVCYVKTYPEADDVTRFITISKSITQSKRAEFKSKKLYSQRQKNVVR